jgi:hypothetical protein
VNVVKKKKSFSLASKIKPGRRGVVGCGRGFFWKRVTFGWFEQTNYRSIA